MKIFLHENKLVYQKWYLTKLEEIKPCTILPGLTFSTTNMANYYALHNVFVLQQVARNFGHIICDVGKKIVLQKAKLNIAKIFRVNTAWKCKPQCSLMHNRRHSKFWGLYNFSHKSYLQWVLHWVHLFLRELSFLATSIES